VAADVHGVEAVPDPHGYDAVVLGSAVHARALLPAAEHFVLSNSDALRVMPVWLFSIGIGPSLRGPIGHFLRDAVPPRIAELCELVGPRDYHAFAGVVPRANAPLVARLMLRICGGRYGDLRDWPAIDAWTKRIAAYLHGAVAA
jgi:menaquinone-dependent protoporphyrinogen oxidase